MPTALYLPKVHLNREVCSFQISGRFINFSGFFFFFDAIIMTIQLVKKITTVVSFSLRVILKFVNFELL